jgi:uncharacterized protein YecE (DUF72 family)
MTKADVYIGCSGFAYKEWKDVFYPKGLPQTKWFQFYCEHFNSLEINSSFYRFPKLEALKGWYIKSPEGFRFSLKVPKFITHYRHLRGDAVRMLNEFYDLVQKGLNDKLGCVLFQMPKQYIYTEENLEQLIQQLNNSFQNAIEFRDESWWRPNIIRQLKKSNIIFCGHSYPNLPDNLVVTADTVYYRFHGVPVLYKSAYSKSFVKEITNEIINSRKTSFIYFNNTWGTSALKNSMYMQQLMEKSKTKNNL